MNFNGKEIVKVSEGFNRFVTKEIYEGKNYYTLWTFDLKRSTTHSPHYCVVFAEFDEKTVVASL